AAAYRSHAASPADKAGGFILSTDTTAILGWMESFGAEIIRPGGDGYNFDTPQVRDTFKYLRGLYDSGCAWLLPDNQPPQADFAARRGLFAVGSLADLPYQAAAFQQIGSTDEWTVLPFPSPVGKPALIFYGPSYEILASTPERQLAAWLFLKWLVAPQNQAQLAAATGAFPSRDGGLAALADYRKSHPQWASAAGLLPLAQPEPSYRSWGLVRWAVSDAATQLFRSYFNIAQVPELGKLLDQTAADLHAEQQGK
ncbi:MAG TPA: extracellular solute-binding protein, partial [Anaerolineales bacterium]